MSTRVRVAAGLSCVLLLWIVAGPSVPLDMTFLGVDRSVIAWGEEPTRPVSKQEGRGQWLDFGTPGLQADPDVQRMLQTKVSYRDHRTQTSWWSPLGPNFIVDGQIGVSGRAREVAGRVISVAVHPDPEKSRRIWLVGTAGGGIWRTENAGKTWKRAKIPGYPSSLAVGAIAFGSGDTVYAGTGDTSRQGLSGSGLLVSVKSGEEWEPFDVDLDNGDKSNSGAGRPWLLTAVTGIVKGPPGTSCGDDMDSGDSLWVAVATARGARKSGEDQTKLGLFYLAGCRERGEKPKFKAVFAGPPRPVSDLKKAPPPSPAPTPPPGDCVFVARSTPPSLVLAPEPLLVHRVCLPKARGAGFDIYSLVPANTIGFYAKLAAFEKNSSKLYLGFVRSSGVVLRKTDHAWDDQPPWVDISFDGAATPENPNDPVGYCNWDPASGTPKKDVCHHANVLSVSPTNPDIVFAGGVALWECRDCRPGGRQKWRDISYLTPPDRPGNFISPSDGIHVDQQAMAWSGDKRLGFHLIVVNDGGVWSAPDPSRTKDTDRVQWTNHSLGLEITQIYRGALDRRRPSVVLAGTQDTGTIRRHSGWPGRWLERWRWIQGGDGVGVVVSHKDPALHWATLHQSVLVDGQTRLAMWRTRDSGLSFQRADLGIERKTTNWVPPFVQCPYPQGDVLLYGDRSLWRVDEFFRIPTLRAFEASSPPTWRRNFRPEKEFDEQDRQINISAIAFAPDHDKTPARDACRTYAFADTTGIVRITKIGGGVVKPSDKVGHTTPWCEVGQATTWCEIGKKNQWPGRKVSALAFAMPTVLYATIASYNTHGSRGHVFRIEKGTDWNADWEDVTPPDTPGIDVPFQSLAIIPRKGAQEKPIVFAGSTLGVWLSPNDGAGWCRLPVDTHTPDVWVEDLKVHPKNDWVYAFTFGRGVFRLEDVGEAVSACRELLKPKP